MQVYILDDQIRRTEVVENFESMIWTERYNEFGDFQMDIDPKLAEKPLTKQDTMLATDKSDRVMYIDFIENTFNSEGKRILTIKGKSLEARLQQRPNDYTAIAAGTAAAALSFGPNTPGDIIRNLFHSICRTNTAPFDVDNFPFIQAGVYSAPTEIPEPTDVVTVQSPINNLYETIKSIAQVYNLGFRIIRPDEDSKLYFEVYTGYDRTSGQTTNEPVIFSHSLDSLDNTKELTSSTPYKNVAYVFASNGSRVVYGNADATTSGFEKKILIVDASDIDTPAGATLNSQLDQRGAEELAKNGFIWGFDGEIPNNSRYVYPYFYQLGDIVEKRSDEGFVNRMRVTEQIFTHDAEGEKSYPTLTIESLVLPGTWDAISGSKTWDSYTTEHWDDL